MAPRILHLSHTLFTPLPSSQVRELLTEARGCYKKKGGVASMQVNVVGGVRVGRGRGLHQSKWNRVCEHECPVIALSLGSLSAPSPMAHASPFPQIEQSLKLARLLSGLHGRAARREVLELLGAVQEAAAGLPHLEDRLSALVDSAQV